MLTDVKGKVTFNFGDPEGSIRYFRKVGTHRIIKRGYADFVRGRAVLIAEDVIVEGGTVLKTKVAVEAVGAYVIGVVCFSNRSGGKVTAETLGVPFLLSLMDVDMTMHREEECPDCEKFGPESVRQDLGKGREFLERTNRHDLLK